MKELRLEIRGDAYELSLEGNLLASLPGGAAALLRGSGDPLRASDLEVLIERSEEWIMPASKAFQRLELHVRGGTGRLRARPGQQPSLTASEVEEAFNDGFTDVVRNRAVDPYGIADLVLVCELVHHGSLETILLE
jgi:hypothetical protein